MGQDRAVECHGKQSTNDTWINEGVTVSKIHGSVLYWKEHFTSATPSSLKSVLPLAFFTKQWDRGEALHNFEFKLCAKQCGQFVNLRGCLQKWGIMIQWALLILCFCAQVPVQITLLTMGTLQPAENVPLHCRAWTWPRCHHGNGPGTMGREPPTTETWMLQGDPQRRGAKVKSPFDWNPEVTLAGVFSIKFIQNFSLQRG